MTTRIACFGGIYNNYLALEAAIADAQRRGVDQMFCLGDLGAFGPHPDRVFPLLHQHEIQVVRGNYDDSIGRGLNDCQCGYTDPRDNHFAQISYDYTLQNTSSENRAYLCTLPAEIRLEIEGRQLLLCHGSPRRTNEFLWESTTSTSFLNWLADQQQADLILATHTGIHWGRELSNRRAFVNVGVLGRPANDGRTEVWYAIISVDPHSGISWQFVPLEYDFRRLSSEMTAQRLPPEFIETIQTGWWTTCLEILPAKERRWGLY
ncbi:metallophosphatase family protein [Blastopirellula sp. J2-11]|uniref:metallophosphoesterase family protein n=1 Tax=Blastopirellula sp. J2-11 TaxID=2943192 RepID=UPI0021C965E7|nr:metallophosphatase family protein [Blastopirellula sp. J2-11]UUO08505.1 metallophosphatase family protein [Blastopirellula sp. J2-11]